MDYNQLALEKHKKWNGKLEVVPKCPLKTREDLSIAYTPGVAAPCLEIQNDISKSFVYTNRGNCVAVITDGTAVLGLGDIGPEAGMPVMEGKCVLFKEFAGVDAFPLCISSKNTDEIVSTISLIAGSFGGINLEDISAPRCFEIEQRLKEKLSIPVFHDDQHGTAIVTAAALINALRLAGKNIKDVTAVVNGAGAAGIACSKLFLAMGIKDVILCDRNGALSRNNTLLTGVKKEIAEITNTNCLSGTLEEIIKGKDIFLGVSAPNCVTKEMVASMNEKAIVFACANPVPEIYPEEAKAGGAFIVGTGRSDYPNQINNVLAFPGVFRGALDIMATEINDDMKIAAVYALADAVPPHLLNTEFIIPDVFDKSVAVGVASAVAAAAIKSGVAAEKNKEV